MVRRTVLVIVPLVAALLALGIVPRLRADEHLKTTTAAQAVPVVQTVHPRTGAPTRELVLPGRVAPFADASIYARTSGYLTRWYCDIGTRVKAGTLLATIEAPELDAQLNQAKADRDTAQANFAIAQTTAERWQALQKTQSVAQQDTDLKLADMQAKRATLESAQANVVRLTQLQSYERVVAPFDGVLTARNVDTGSIVDAGGSGGGTSSPAAELFHIEQTGQLRVFVQVPEDSAPAIMPSTPVYLSSSRYPGRNIAASVSRTSESITPTNRTLLAEIDVDNRDGALMPGAYVEAHLTLKAGKPTFELPINALLFRPSGVTVAEVDAQGIVSLKTVKISRDFGTYVELSEGVAATDEVILNPGDSIYAGAHVQVEAPGAQHG